MTEFKIEGPGEYRTRDGRKAIVTEAVSNNPPWAFKGHVETVVVHKMIVGWSEDGKGVLESKSHADIVGPWVEIDPEEDDDLTADVITTSIALAAIEDGTDTDEDYDDEPEQPAPVPPGIAHRMWLAGMAMQGILANTLTANSSNADAAGYAVAYADAMLKALEEKP